MRNSFNRLSFICATTSGVALLIGGSALGSDSYDIVEGEVFTELGIGLQTEGSLIGDYDAESNPGGTKTIPGLIGGSGNHDIPVTASLDTDGRNTTTPEGTFDLDIGLFGVSGVFDNMSIDLLKNQDQTYITSITMRYNSFHTKNPTGLYPGGIPITIPFAFSQVTGAKLDQLLPAFSVFIPGGSGEMKYGTLMLCTVTIESAILGQELPTMPIPALAWIEGSIYDLGSEGIDVTMEIDFPNIDLDLDLPIAIPLVSDLEFDLPNIGEDPTVLFSLDLEGVSLLYDTDIDFIAHTE